MQYPELGEPKTVTLQDFMEDVARVVSLDTANKMAIARDAYRRGKRVSWAVDRVRRA